MHEIQNKIRTLKPKHIMMQQYAFTALVLYTYCF